VEAWRRAQQLRLGLADDNLDRYRARMSTSDAKTIITPAMQRGKRVAGPGIRLLSERGTARGLVVTMTPGRVIA
jgi:hypothetical protein